MATTVAGLAGERPGTVLTNDKRVVLRRRKRSGLTVTTMDVAESGLFRCGRFPQRHFERFRHVLKVAVPMADNFIAGPVCDEVWRAI